MTSVEMAKEISIKNPIFCPACGETIHQESLYCSWCGKAVHRFITEEHSFCPQCGLKNSPQSKVCYSCSFSFSNWRAMEGKAAELIGWHGNIDLYESYNNITYRIISDDELGIGRDEENAVYIPCDYVSAKHCSIDVVKQKLVDLDSENGTFANRVNEKIETLLIPHISEFNIAGLFTFKVHKNKQAFIFRLGSILDKDDVEKHIDLVVLDNLLSSYFIVPRGDCEILVRKIDGAIATEVPPEEKYWQLKIQGGYYYITDHSTDHQKLLILKEHNQYWLPKNWKVDAEAISE